MRRKCWGIIGLLAVAPALARAGEPRLALHGNAVLAAGDLDFGTSRTLHVLSRDVSVTASYSLDAGFGFDFGLELRLSENLGVRASVSRATREGDGVLMAELPPLPFGLPSRVDATLADGRVEETAAHFDLVLGGALGALRASAFGGLTLFDLEARLLGPVTFTIPGLPPIPVGSATAVSVSDSPAGWNAGFGLDVRLSDRLGLGGFLRYAQAKATLAPPGFDPFEVDAGGVHVGAGLRLLF